MANLAPSGSRRGRAAGRDARKAAPPPGTASGPPRDALLAQPTQQMDAIIKTPFASGPPRDALLAQQTKQMDAIIKTPFASGPPRDAIRRSDQAVSAWHRGAPSAPFCGTERAGPPVGCRVGRLSSDAVRSLPAPDGQPVSRIAPRGPGAREAEVRGR